MIAVIEINGQQLKVSPKERLYVPKLKENIGSMVTFDRVLMIVDGATVRLGDPILRSEAFDEKILSHVRDEKVIVFKKKKRKGYRLRRGHRQQYTEIEITKIE